MRRSRSPEDMSAVGCRTLSARANRMGILAFSCSVRRCDGRTSPRRHGEDRQRLRSADDGSARAGAAVPLARRVPGLRLAGQPRRAVQARAGAGAVVADGRPDDLALQAAPGRAVPRRLAVHRRRRGVLDRARADAAVAALVPAARHDRGEEGRRADARGPARGARRGAAREARNAGDDEQGLVREAQRRGGAGLQRQAGNLRGAQRQRHRALPARALRARRAHRAQAQRRAGGAGATGARATSTRWSGWRSAPTRPGWPR